VRELTYPASAHERRFEEAPLCWADAFDELATGQSFRTPERALTEADVNAFAALTGDHHPQHTDPTWAAASPFGERIAHGLLVISAAAGLVPFDPARVVALRRIGDVVFKRPVRLGETIRVSGRIEELKPIDENAGLVTLSWSVAGADGRAACRARVEVLWARDTYVPIPL
jgi:acyl dehydratase